MGSIRHDRNRRAKNQFLPYLTGLTVAGIVSPAFTAGLCSVVPLGLASVTAQNSSSAQSMKCRKYGVDNREVRRKVIASERSGNANYQELMKFERHGLSSISKAGMVAIALAIATSAWAENRNAKVIGVKGDARYQTGGGSWQPLKTGDVVPPGSVVQTAAGSMLDLLLDGKVDPSMSSGAGGGGLNMSSGRIYNPPPTPPSQSGSVVRLQENTILGIDKLTSEHTGADVVKDTQLDLKKGNIFGTTQKVSGASRYEVKMPHGVAAIRGTIFSLSTDGTVYVLSGSVYITTNKPDGTVVTMLVPAGSSFNPLTALPGAQPTPITVPESSSLEQVIANMGYPVYSAPVDYALDNTTVWISPVRGQ